MRSPKRVVGLDLSSEMLKSAIDHPDQAAFRVEYQQHDLVNELPANFRGAFDLVTSTYLLCYAQNTSVLDAFVRHCFDACKPGAHFISLTDNMSNTPDEHLVWADYG